MFNSFPEFEAYVEQIKQASPQDAQQLVNQLWEHLYPEQRIPLVFADRAVFMYRGKAHSLNWVGDFSRWRMSRTTRGKQVGKTDLFMREMRFPIDARIEYQIVLDDQFWLLDPCNPKEQGGGYGINSVLEMPDFKSTSYAHKQSDIAHGTMTEPILLDSEALGYTLAYRVYTPANYADLDTLPVLYVTDGNDFGHEKRGALPLILDNMLAEDLIQPVMVVLVDALDPNNRTHNRRMREYIENKHYAQFMAEELVPIIDDTYKTAPTPSQRVIVGTSLGGVASLYIGVKYPHIFQNIVAFSPALWASRQLADLWRNNSHPYKVFLTSGIPQWDVGNLQWMVDLLQNKAHNVTIIQVQEGHTWGHWSDLTDEMLVNFFPRL